MAREAAAARPEPRVLAVELLRSRGADRIPHVGGDLLSHLIATSALLGACGCSTSVVLAGLCHACYGTDGFPHPLLDLSERSVLEAAIGPDAEGIVYFYASCDRSFFHPAIGRRRQLRFRDRFTKEIHAPAPAMVRQFIDLTFANELEIAHRNPSFLERSRAPLAELFSRCEGLVSDRLSDCFLQTFGRADARTG